MDEKIVAYVAIGLATQLYGGMTKSRLSNQESIRIIAWTSSGLSQNW